MSARVFQPSTKAGALRSAGSALLVRRFVSHSVESLLRGRGAAGLLAGILIAGSAGLAGAIAGMPSFVIVRISLHRGRGQRPRLRILADALGRRDFLQFLTCAPAGTSARVAAWLNCNARM